MAYHTLVPIRNVYIALHQDTISVPTRFSASTGDNDHVLFESTAYPVCNVAGHIHNNPASTSFARSTAPAPASLAGLDVPSSSRNVPLRVVQSPTSVPLLNNTHPALQTTAENRRVPPIIPGLVAARVMQSGTDTSTTTIPLSTPEPSVTISPASIASTPAPGIAIQRIPDHRTSDLPDVASLLSSIQVPDDMPTTVPHASLPVNSSVTRSGRASLPDSHPSPLVPASPDPSHPRLRSAPDPGAVVEVEGSAEAVLHQEWNTLDPPSAIRENVIAMRDLPPQSPSSSSATDVAIMGPSWHALGDHSP
ncbi:hypothetical protein EDB89DRAFT_1951041 [Lactarius sanguifluus]|nr:hypothetical protein EDB89DRAFT_1951041 [Lactarius sanguifluus]